MKTFDKTEFAKQFQMFFEEKVNRLVKESKIDKVMAVFDKHYKKVKSWDLKEVTNEQVARVMDKLKSTLRAGPDKISNKLIKTFKFKILQPITDIINQRFREKYFPDAWKSAKVVPVFKRVQRTIQKYRHIGLTSNLFKIIKSLVQYQI